MGECKASSNHCIPYGITPVAEVPSQHRFDSSIIGNPTFDPMDVLRFSGGHADETQVSCITSITYKINSKHSLKCVGKNPKLAAAKSKNNKNITGLLNQVEAGKIVVYNFVNTAPFTIGNNKTEVLAINFTSKEDTTATFLAEILFEVKTDEVIRTIHGTIPAEKTDAEKDATDSDSVKEVDFTFSEIGQSELTVTYKMNNEEVKTFYPKKTCIAGKHILTLFLPITQVIENSENILSVLLNISGGTMSIGEMQIRATISGQGLVAGIGDWNGRISISEAIDSIPIAETRFVHDGFTDRATVTFPAQKRNAITQHIGRISIADVAFGYDLLNERLSVTEVIKTFTVDKNFSPHYDMTMVEVNENGAFCMISDYTYVSESEEIISGMLQHLAVNTEQFERVERLEVVKC